MSLFAERGMLVRELWPPPIAATLAALDDGVSTEMDSLPPWTVVPDDYDELCGWAIIMPDEVDKGNSVLLYSPDINPLDNGEQLKVSIILHGVVEAVNLNPLGNWNGMKETTQRAVQYVTLGAGSWPEIFGKQVEALGKIKDFVGSVLRDDIGDYTRSPETTIYCHRPVFTRATGADGKRVKSVLKAGDDPHGRAKIVEKMWVVGHRVRTGIRTGEENHSRPPSVIRVGDFVEVAACIDIIRQKKNKSWERKMRLTITEVVRTHSSDEVKAIVDSDSKQSDGEGEDKDDCIAAAQSGPKTLSVFGLSKDEQQKQRGKQKQRQKQKQKSKGKQRGKSEDVEMSE